MADAVESMAYANEVPWHGLGTNVNANISTANMIEQAGLDWTVSRQPMQALTSHGAVDVPGQYALMRDTDQRVLSVVSERYQPVQNSQLFDFFREYVDAGDATMETAGSLYDGRTIWALANVGEAFSLTGDDEVRGYLLLANSHQPGTTLRIMLTTIRVVCANTLHLAETKDASAAVRMTHRQIFDEDMQQSVKTRLGIARHQIRAFKDVAQRLEQIQMTESKAQEFFTGLVGDPELEIDDQPRVVEKLTNLFSGEGQGSEMDSARGTAWGALNAVTEYYDHWYGRNQNSRLQSAWLGPNAKIKGKALDQLTAA